jgi:DNA-binding response OmpR family regulator
VTEPSVPAIGPGSQCFPEAGKNMNERVRVLLVESDAELAATIQQHLESRLGFEVCSAAGVQEALQEEKLGRYHLAVTATSLEDGDGFHLLQELRALTDCPVIFLADGPSPGELIASLRLGVTDVLTHPVDLDYLARVVSTTAARLIEQRRETGRRRRLRKVASRIIRERRELRQKMDLICCDVVQAYRRLAQEVTDAGVLVHK